MANILLLDDSDVAGRAMQGILARGQHGCLVTANCEDAWRQLRDAVVIDLVVVELKAPLSANKTLHPGEKLPENAGLLFLAKLRDDSFLKKIPVVVYTTVADATQVRRALSLKAQNYLIKPYNESAIFAEIAKAVANPWRNLHFEEAKSFCAQLNLTPEGVAKLRRDLMTKLDECAAIFPSWTTTRENATVFEVIDAVANEAEGAGAWGVVDYLHELRTHAETGNWTAFKFSAESLEYASRLIFCQLNPSYVPDRLRSEEDIAREKEAAERKRWMSPDVDRNGPILTAKDVEKQVIALPGCPVIDTVAAAFLMSADGRATSINALMELVASDPGLSAQVLIAVNRRDGEEAAPMEDPRTAVSLIGVLKLNALAKALPTMPARHMHVGPINWPDFWMFQVGVGKLSEFICDYLDLTYLRGNAYTAGLLHDLGKLFLVRLYPFGFAAMVQYAQDHKVSLPVAEQKYLGCTARDMGSTFAAHANLPRVYSNVIRWVETPALATENVDLVSIVALARNVCMRNKLGCSGDLTEKSAPVIAETAAWSLIQPRLFPSFELGKFEAQAHAFAAELRQQLTGRRR